MSKYFFFIGFFLLSNYYVKGQRISAYQAGSYQPGLMNVRDLVAASGSGLILIIGIIVMDTTIKMATK